MRAYLSEPIKIDDETHKWIVVLPKGYSVDRYIAEWIKDDKVNNLAQYKRYMKKSDGENMYETFRRRMKKGIIK